MSSNKNPESTIPVPEKMSLPDHNRYYIAIDLKSFYASVECIERNVDALRTNLVVADASRTEKTICLAVSPSLKALGIGGRARLFEVVQQVAEANALRRSRLHGSDFSGRSTDVDELAADPTLAIDYIAAKPRMSLYLDYSARVYDIYLNYVAPEDIHSYSIDEVFMDVTDYLGTYHTTPHELARRIVCDIQSSLKLTATVGIGTNLYLAKVAMDIMAKHIDEDEYGVRIAELDEPSYRRSLWAHEPLTDFWRVGHGLAKKLIQHGLYTMGDIARCSIGGRDDFYNEDLLYRLFGINAELLIDHAWGWEPTRISDIKAYQPKDNSVCSGQVLQCPYPYDKARLIVREMTDLLVLDLVRKGWMTSQIVLAIGYDRENLTDPERRKAYRGPVKTDHYGRIVPKSAHGSVNLGRHTSSTVQILDATTRLFEEITDPRLLVRRVTLTANHLRPAVELALEQREYTQLSLFDAVSDDTESTQSAREEEKREQRLQRAILSVQDRFGKNALLRGMNLDEGGTTIIRNRQIGGHSA